MTDARSRLTELLAECEAYGIRLLPEGDGGLTIEAPQQALTPDLMAELKSHKAQLLNVLRLVGGESPQIALFAPGSMGWPELEQRNLQDPTLKKERDVKPVCRCGSIQSQDVPIHGGQSVRRDCESCRRFLGFPVWYGNVTLPNE
jgi:hypothetical protein